MTASDLFAIAHSKKNQGDQECHYCASKCEKTFPHQDALPIPFVRSLTTALRPGNRWVCKGCWLFARKYITVRFLGGGFKDRQCLKNHSLWITPEGVWGLLPTDAGLIYKHLLNPPLTFSLSLLSEPKVENLLQLMTCNDLSEIIADTELKFTIDNKVHSYCVYELKEALRHGVDGKMPGVRALVERLGPHPLSDELPPVAEEKRRKGGHGSRPKTDKPLAHNPSTDVITSSLQKVVRPA